MATTTIDNRSINDNRVFYWSIAIIIAVALAIVFTVRRTSIQDTSPTIIEQHTAPTDPLPPAPVLEQQQPSMNSTTPPPQRTQ